MFYTNYNWWLVFDGEGDNDPGSDDSGSVSDDPGSVSDDPGSVSDDPEPKSKQSKDSKKFFTQEEVERLVQKEKQGLRKNQQKQIEELENMKQKFKFTKEEKDQLEQRIEDLRNETLTKEQLREKEQKKKSTEHQKQLKDVTDDRDYWKLKYNDEIIHRELHDAATKPGQEAYSPKQIIALLKSETRLVNEVDQEGNETGRLVPKTKLQDKDEKGNIITLDLHPEQAVKRMTEIEEYLNLFKGSGVNGLGRDSGQKGKDVDRSNLIKSDPAKYVEMRNKGELTL